MQNLKLSPEESAALRGLRDREEGLQRFVQQVTEAGERRIAELVQEKNAFWEGMNKAHPEANLKNVSYIPTPDFSELKPVAQRFE